MERDKKKFHEENLNYCSLFFSFKGLRNVKISKSFFFQKSILYPVKHLKARGNESNMLDKKCWMLLRTILDDVGPTIFS